MANQGQMQQMQQPQNLGQAQGKDSLAPVLQQLNLTSLRTRTQDLHNAIGRILHTFHTNPSLKWTEVLGQFAMVNVELLNLIDDVKPILKMFVVYPKNVNAENAPILPIMLSSKLLPEMEAEEAALKEKILASLSAYNMNVQSDNLQRQIESVRAACDIAEKVITEARKVYGLGTRQGPVPLATMDKLNVARIAEQEKLLRAATNFGEGLRTTSEQQQQPSSLPPHLASVLATPQDSRTAFGDAGFAKTSAAPVLPPTGHRSVGTPQQTSVPQVTTRVHTPSQPVGVAGIASASPSQVPYVNSPRSGGTNFNVPSPQQQQQQAAQLSYLQNKMRTQQQLQAQRQQQQQQALHQQQQQQQQQQAQLRRPATPPIPQVGGQSQAQAAQPLLHQQQQQKLQQLQQQAHLQQLQQQHQAHQQQSQLQQQLQAQQDRHSLQQLQAQQQQQQQQNLQQMQASQPMMGSNQLQQGNQVRNQMGQMGNSMTSLYGGGGNTLLTSNMYQQGNMSGNALGGNQPQRNVSSQMLTDSMYIGGGTQMAQGTSNLGMQMQQQLVNQPNYMNMFNNTTQSNFGQNRQQQPPS
ncbi:hypothetical protein R1sor_020362 [Riccia sorocarpa]|uniref:Mediator of RNA polymerase II transcription subunit 8 n=1 Tax=Riccia sorocarpa TaxID=122646 RepID=A0ABD3IIV5_9MARC